MRVLSRPLNKGEVFPCRISKAKNTFSETTVVLNFSTRIYGTFKNTFDMFYLKNNIKGIVISSMYMHPGEQNPFLNFYVIKKEQFTDKLQLEFEEKFLKEYFVFYKDCVRNSHMFRM